MEQYDLRACGLLPAHGPGVPPGEQGGAGGGALGVHVVPGLGYNFTDGYHTGRYAKVKGPHMLNVIFSLKL